MCQICQTSTRKLNIYTARQGFPWCSKSEAHDVFVFQLCFISGFFENGSVFFFFFSGEKLHVKLGDAWWPFPKQIFPNKFTLQTPLDQVEGRLVQAQVKEKTKSGTSNSIKRFLG